MCITTRPGLCWLFERPGFWRRANGGGELGS
jgi:hypothetical protein